MKHGRASLLLGLVLIGLFGLAAVARAQEPPAPAAPSGPTTADLKIMADTMWVLVTGMLVFFMNLGFGCVESGFCRAKNCVNILSKNFIVFGATSIGFYLLGWGIMFGGGSDWFGTEGLFMVGGQDNSPATGDAYQGVYGAINWTGVPLWAKFFFQLVFAGTAATIVSGTVAERIKYHSFILFTFIMAIAIYPVVGHWIWGGGFLSLGKIFGADSGMFDFAGSTVVHSVGGWAGLAGIIVLGPRIGKYGPGGRINAIPGHNLLAATIGCFVLWFGWFGFNPGSTMAADPGAIARVCVTTNSAAAAATLSATLTAWLLLGKPDLGMTLNGCLAGLVAITAPCAFVSVPASVVIGLVAGVLVVLAVIMFDRLYIDDPVGALSVHLVNGIFGTLCVGLFGLKEIAGAATGLANDGLFNGGGTAQLIPQAVGVVVVGAYVFVVALIAWSVLKATVGIRVPPAEELAGLDIGEHGNEAYHGFVMAAAAEALPAATDGTPTTGEPRPATVPPGDVKRFNLIVEGVDTGELIHAWSELCLPKSAPPPPEFQAVYPYMTTMQGNRFRFRDGDAQVMKNNLERLLRDRTRNASVRVHAES